MRIDLVNHHHAQSVIAQGGSPDFADLRLWTLPDSSCYEPCLTRQLSTKHQTSLPSFEQPSIFTTLTFHHHHHHHHQQSFFYQKEEELSEKSVTRPNHAVHTSPCRSRLILITRSTETAQRLCGSCTSVDPLDSTEDCEYSRFLHTGYRRYSPSNGDFNGCGRALEFDSETPSSLQPASFRTATTKFAIRGTTVRTQISSSLRTDQCPSSTSSPRKCERRQSAHPSTELIGEQRCQQCQPTI